jgi:hypothetical protein
VCFWISASLVFYRFPFSRMRELVRTSSRLKMNEFLFCHKKKTNTTHIVRSRLPG